MTIAQFDALKVQRSFDALHLGDVIEHLPDPLAVLERLLVHLRPGGILFVEGPLENNPSPVLWAARAFGAVKRRVRPAFVAGHAPTHLFRTDARAQRSFFDRLHPYLESRHWRVHETGWPYEHGSAVKRAIARWARRLGGRRFGSATLGNRFQAIFCVR